MGSRLLVVVVASICCACGPPTNEMDGGELDAGVRDAGVRDAGVADAGVMPVDAGPQTPTASGSMTVNGASLLITDGFATRSATSVQLHLNTSELLSPQVQMTIVLPPNVGVGVPQLCGSPTVLFAGRWIVDSQIAFFTLNQTCDVGLTTLAANVGDDYVGTFSGTATYEPRSALDAGFQLLTVTNGTFTVRRF